MADPIFYGYRSNPRMADLLMAGGDAQAQHAQRMGELWANTLGNIGGIAAGAIQQHQEQKAQSKNERALLSALDSWDDADPQGSAMRLVSVVGPKEGLRMAEGFNSLRKNATNDDPKTHLATTRAGIQFWEGLSPEGKAQAWGRFRETLAPTVSKLGLPVELPEQYVPEIEDTIRRAGGAIDTFLGKEPKAPEKPKLTNVTVAGPDGRPMEQAFTEEQLRAGVPKYVEPPKPEKREKTLAEIEAEAAARARGSASVKPVDGPEELTLSPEGVVLSSFGPKLKNEARRQAAERGLPVFENSSTQTKGMTLKGIVDEAKELADLLEDDAVAAVVGPALTNPLKALRRASGGYVDLDPKAQRALQLAGMLSDSELRKRSGASAGDAEMKRILGFAVSPTMPLGNLKANLQGMLKAGARDYKFLSGVDLLGSSAAAAPAKALADKFRQKYGTTEVAR